MIIRDTLIQALIALSLTIGIFYFEKNSVMAQDNSDILDNLPAILARLKPILPTGVAPVVHSIRCNPGSPVNLLPKVEAGTTLAAGWNIYDPDTRIDRVHWSVDVNGVFYQGFDGNLDNIIYSTHEDDRGIIRFTMRVTDDTRNVTFAELCEFEIITPSPVLFVIGSIEIDDNGGLIPVVVVESLPGKYIEEGAIYTITQGPTDNLIIDPMSGRITFQGNYASNFSFGVTVNVANPDGRNDNEEFILYVTDSD